MYSNSLKFHPCFASPLYILFFSVSSINFVLPLLSLVGLGVFLLFLNRSVPFCSVRSPRTMFSPWAGRVPTFFNRFILFRSFSKNDVQPLSWACSYCFKSFHFDPFVLQEQCLVLDRGVFLLFFISFSSVRSRERTIVPQELFSLWWLSCLPSFDFFFLCLLFIPIIQFFHLVF